MKFSPLLAITCCLTLLASGLASAQTAATDDARLMHYAQNYSSSAYSSSLALSTFVSDDGVQYGGGGPCCAPQQRPPVYRQPVYAYTYPEPWISHFAFESGFGLTAPLGGAANSTNTAWTFTEGAGYNVDAYFAVLGEYGFSRFGLSDNVLNSVGAPGGNVHLWSLTVEPEVRINPQDQVMGYVIGGGGFYHVLTSLTAPNNGTICDPFYGCYPTGGSTPYAQQSSSQGGWNIGGGVEYKPWGYSRLGVYGEARFLWLDTPGRHSEFFPLTFGIRF